MKVSAVSSSSSLISANASDCPRCVGESDMAGSDRGGASERSRRVDHKQPCADAHGQLGSRSLPRRPITHTELAPPPSHHAIESEGDTCERRSYSPTFTSASPEAVVVLQAMPHLLFVSLSLSAGPANL
eukprot:760852-Hanusia_phi.AAC.7